MTVNARTILTALVVTVVLFAATSSDSLWIDEGDTACYAIQPSLADWASHLSLDRAADCQFPLYVFLVWAWGKITGTSEFALRSLNVVFALIALGSFAALGKGRSIRCLWVALLLQPFFWFYLNEARPYMLQLAAGSVLLASFLLLLQRPEMRLAWAWFLVGIVLLHYSTMLAPVTIGVFCLALLFLVRRKELFLPKGWLRWLSLLPVALLPGVLHYINTVLRGSGGSRIWPVGVANFAWIGYEIAGAVGLGPPVWRMRDFARETLASGISFHAMTPLFLPGLLCLACAGVLVLGFCCLRPDSSRRRDFFYLAFLFVFVFAGFAILALAFQKPVWARHLAPVFPAYALAFYYALCELARAGQGAVSWRRLLAGGCALLLVLSSSLLVLSPVHKKDDYRRSAGLALDALRNGKTVWWAASWHTAAYYGLPIVEGKSTVPNFQVLMGPGFSDLQVLGKPDLVLLSRKDVFDHAGSIRDYCQKAGYELPDPQPRVFTFWRERSGGGQPQVLPRPSQSSN